MNVFDEAGILGIAARMQRLSEQIRKDGFLIYKAYGIDFEPKWFPVVYSLYFKPGLSVVELASEIGFTHPSVITLLKELEKVKLVTSKKHDTDERKRMLYLSSKGKSIIDKMKPVWEVIIQAVTELTNTENNLMKAIIEVEERIAEQSFFERAKKFFPDRMSKSIYPGE